MTVYNGDSWKNPSDDGNAPEKNWVQRTQTPATLKFDISSLGDAGFEIFKEELELNLSEADGINRFQGLKIEKTVEKFSLIATVSWQPSELFVSQKSEIRLAGAMAGGDLLNAEHSNIQDTGLEI